MQFRKLEVWHRSKKLAVQVYKESTKIRDFGFKDQITRSALSVPSNIAEGFEKDYTKEKARFLAIAKGSLGEFLTQTEIGIEAGFIQKDVGGFWINEGEQISKMIGQLSRNLKF